MSKIVLPDMWLIAGSGAGVGKDTAGEFLADALKFRNVHPILLSFAYRLKKMAQEKYQIDFKRMAEDRDYKNQVRPLLIKLGNDMRYDNPFCWAEMCEEDFLDLITVGGAEEIDEKFAGVVRDARYLNEPDQFLYRSKQKYDKVRVIYIHCNDETVLERFGTEAFQKYILGKRDRSEREMKHYRRDYLISNDKSLEYLRKAIEAIVTEEYGPSQF